MTTTLHHIYRRWKRGRRQRKLQQLLSQRELICKSGLSLYVVVDDCVCTGLAIEGFQLVRVRLKIRLLDNCVVEPRAYAFVPNSWGQIKGLPVRIQFAAGDLSQVIIKI